MFIGIQKILTQLGEIWACLIISTQKTIQINKMAINKMLPPKETKICAGKKLNHDHCMTQL